MGMSWRIVVHPKALQELEDLPVLMRARLTRLLEAMQKAGPLAFREPHVKSLGHKLWEIRLKSQEGMGRVIYITLTDQRLGILHAFVKKTQKTPLRALDCAYQRLKEIE